MKNIIKILASTIFALIVSNACNYNYEARFDKISWITKVDPAFPPPNRNMMLKDLTTNHKLVGLKYSQLIDTLGPPDFKEDYSFGYTIEEKYGHDIDPIYVKSLTFYFSKDSIITSFKVEEWKK